MTAYQAVVFHNLAVVLEVTAMTLLIVGVFTAIAFFVHEMEGVTAASICFLPLVLAVVLFLGRAFIATPGELVNRRIELLKLEAMSDHNVKAGVERIDGILKKLEEKYLGK
jgi:hypothetical protein